MEATASGVAKVVARASMLALANKTLLSAAATATTAAMSGDLYVTTMLPTNNGSSDGGGDDDDQPSISMDNLYPALVQCFAIIICG